MAEQGTPKVGDVFFVKDRNGIYRRTVGRVTPAGKIEFTQRPGMLWNRVKFSGAWEVAGGGWNSWGSACPATPELEAEYDAHCSRIRMAKLAEAIMQEVRKPGFGKVSNEAIAKMDSILADLTKDKEG